MNNRLLSTPSYHLRLLHDGFPHAHNRHYSLSKRLDLLNEIATAINNAGTIQDLYQTLHTQLRWLFSFEHASFYIQRGDQWNMIPLAGTNCPEKVLDDNDTILSTLLRGEPQLFTQGQAEGVLAKYPSIMVVPLISEQEVFGTLQFASSTLNNYMEDDVRLLRMLANQIATVLRNHQRIDSLKAAQQQLANYTTELEERNEELDAYSYRIAHDLKAPLNIVYGYTHLLEMITEDKLGEDGVEFIQKIRLSAEMMTRMIEQLLFLARLHDPETSFETVEAASTVAAAVERYRKDIEDKGILLEIDPALPNAYGQSAWVEEVFANLTGNAVKYIGENNPTPRIAIRGQRVGDMVRYEISDNGIGIREDDQTRLFQKFMRLNTVKVDGSGLGLSIVKRIVKLLNGEVGVESTFGSGSTFWFTLPASQP